MERIIRIIALNEIIIKRCENINYTLPESDLLELQAYLYKYNDLVNWMALITKDMSNINFISHNTNIAIESMLEKDLNRIIDVMKENRQVLYLEYNNYLNNERNLLLDITKKDRTEKRKYLINYHSLGKFY